jgi:hypothetical protein
MSVADCFPVVNVRDEHSGSDDIVRRGIRLLKVALDILECLLRLFIRVVLTDHSSITIGRRCSGNTYFQTGLNRPRVSDS